jgi:hypothetical protein
MTAHNSHTAVAAHEFVVGLHRRLHSWLRLPDPFARVMENSRPLGLWLQADGCCNGPSWVVAEFSSAGSLFLTRGWKSFACSRGLRQGQLLQFRYDGAGTLFVKFFGVSGGRIECCTESESSSGTDSTSESESESDESSSRIKSEGDDSN